MFMPKVAHAAGLSFIAVNRRPYPLRRTATSPIPSRANTTVRSIRKFDWGRKSMPKSFGRGTWRLPLGKIGLHFSVCSQELVAAIAMTTPDTPAAIAAPRQRHDRYEKNTATNPMTMSMTSVAG
jgi:hypothetical protein